MFISIRLLSKSFVLPVQFEENMAVITIYNSVHPFSVTAIVLLFFYCHYSYIKFSDSFREFFYYYSCF